MASVYDVAEHILAQKGRMTAMKLQKLCYYSQAWSLVWDEKPLFQEGIQAWANGPVVPELYNKHRGFFEVKPGEIEGNPSKLTETQRETVDAVLNYYGDKSSHWLSELTHAEQPWVEARSGLDPGERGTAIITHAMMAEYYGSLS